MYVGQRQRQVGLCESEDYIVIPFQTTATTSKAKYLKDPFFSISSNIRFHVSQAGLELTVTKDDLEFLLLLPLPLKG